MNNSKILGEGRLSWSRYERIGDRYGAVFLMADGDSLTPEPTAYVKIEGAPEGQRGRLVAEVVETRDSTHIGDLFRGFFPSTPVIGDLITLGEGTLFVELTDDGATTVGLQPMDGRPTDWLDPEALYRTHEQTVRLHFVAMQ